MQVIQQRAHCDLAQEMPAELIIRKADEPLKNTLWSCFATRFVFETASIYKSSEFLLALQLFIGDPQIMRRFSGNDDTSCIGRQR